ncbi:MAG: transcriptional regulator, LysR family [Thermoleophilia bacterium]|nr:transcriptional regulator, LysR family [Thermoleophilia bacterium]
MLARVSAPDDSQPAEPAHGSPASAAQQPHAALNLQHFGTFLAVVDAGGRLSAAARTLGLSQPGITHHLNELEKRLGAQLLDRGRGRSARLTRAGAVFERYARSIVGLQSALYADLDSMSVTVGGHLRIGATPGLGEHWLPPLLHQFYAAYPDVHLEMRLADATSVIEDVLTHELELGFVAGHWVRPGLQFDAIWEDAFVLVAAPGHALAKAGTLTFDALRGAPFVAQEAGAGLRATFEQELAERGLTLGHFDVQAELGNQESVKSAVASGWGIGCVWRQSIGRELQLGSLVVLDVEGFAPESRYYVVSRTNRRASKRGQALLEFIRHSADAPTG